MVKPTRLGILIIPLIFLFCALIFIWRLDDIIRATHIEVLNSIKQEYATTDLSVGKNNNYSTSSSTMNKAPIPLHVATNDKTYNEDCSLYNLTSPPLPFSEWLIHKKYTRAYVRPQFYSPDTTFGSLEQIKERVLSDFVQLDGGSRISVNGKYRNVDVDVGNKLKGNCPTIINLPVAVEPDYKHTSKILFGLSTTTSRLQQMLPSLLYSFGQSKARLLVMVPDSEDNLPKHEEYFRMRGLDVTLKKSSLDHVGRYFELVRAFKKHIKSHVPETTWVAFIDDDTFFLSLPTFAEKLGKLDARKRHYIGATSEAKWQTEYFGRFGFGGAGVFISLPLLDQLNQVYDECMGWGDQPGDQKLGQCIEKYGQTEFTEWDSLYQVDIRGNVDGLFESGREMDTLHHWLSWYEKDVVKLSTVSAAAGKRSVLRRWIFDIKDKEFWVLTNGYSIVKYTFDDKKKMKTAIDFGKVEYTWDDDMDGFEDSLGPLRLEHVEGVKKERFYLYDSLVIEDNVHQFYVMETDQGHSIIEFVWLGGSEAPGGDLV